MALKNDAIVLSGVWAATLAVLFLVPLAGLVSWMAWRFLLGLEESDEEFEPTVKHGLSITPYTDNPSLSSTRTEVLPAYLCQAYEEQKLREHEILSFEGIANPEEIPALEGELQIDAIQETLSEANTNLPDEVAGPLRCQTIARFEHMSESHCGPHSWFSFPIIPIILSSYATLLLIGLTIWVHEDREYKLRDPSPTLKKTLYMPLGMCLLAFYAYKHRIRASLFEHFDVQLPQPWKKMISILPSWFGTGGTFKNRDTGEITVYDPGRRAFPWRAYHQPDNIRSCEYMSAFNANPGLCDTYWGHSGRNVKTDFRFRATLHRLGFLCLAIYLAVIGFWRIVWYDIPNVYEEVLKHPTTITKADIARISRIVMIWQASVFSAFWSVLFSLLFGLGCMGSMLVLFVRTVWKYVPQEEKDKIARDHREWEQRNVERQAVPA
ncbi:hypothetical protein BKA64DRAFT_700412 [Cadophora sp. MPI-SDFR-AT-0126]|nr:hypothetical protein BKA64DRAFT_700412 [Leotiomycetes sp. MPI-SDFR-AT-0126]